MQFGVQTLPWLKAGRGVPRTLREIQEARFDGVEFAHPPSQLGKPARLLDYLGDLVLLGIAGGALKNRIAYVKEFQSYARPEWQPYVYVDDWEEEVCCQAMREGVRLSLHPHMFKSIQTATDAKELLAKHAKLEFLPDTAHLTIAGEDVMKVVDDALKASRQKESHQITAIHLKDWTPEFGRAYQHYSLGFLPLGKGDVALKDVLGTLKVNGFDGWLIVEQDTAEEPIDTTTESLKWLKNEWTRRPYKTP